MKQPNTPHDRRAFHCTYCGGQILIPAKLPPTTGPCPHCSRTITSPPPEDPDDFTAGFSPTGGRLPKWNQPTRLTSRADAPKRLGPEHIVDDLDELEKTPIKLGIEQYVDDTPKVKPAKPRKPAPNKPVIARQTEEADVSSNHHTEFQQFLIEEARGHTKSMVTTLAIVLLLLVAGGGYYYHFTQHQADQPLQLDVDDIPEDAAQMTAEYIQGGWALEARELLRDFLSATTSFNKTPFILGGEETLPDMVKFYQGSLINDLDTPAEGFKVHPLPAADHERGLFRMRFTGPEKSASNELLQFPEISRPYLLDPAALAATPTIVDAYFLHTDTGLKLDWHLFAQSKYRTLIDFVSHPSPRRKQAFRVLLAADTASTGDSAPHYRVADPSNPTDVIRVAPDPNSPASKALLAIDADSTSQAEGRSATIELAWRGDGDDRKLVIHNFLCWGFLNQTAPAAVDAPSNP